MTMDDPLQSSLLKLSAKGISVFSPHTSLDATPKGINNWYVFLTSVCARSPGTAMRPLLVGSACQ